MQEPTPPQAHAGEQGVDEDQVRGDQQGQSWQHGPKEGFPVEAEPRRSRMPEPAEQEAEGAAEHHQLEGHEPGGPGRDEGFEGGGDAVFRPLGLDRTGLAQGTEGEDQQQGLQCHGSAEAHADGQVRASREDEAEAFHQDQGRQQDPRPRKPAPAPVHGQGRHTQGHQAQQGGCDPGHGPISGRPQPQDQPRHTKGGEAAPEQGRGLEGSGHTLSLRPPARILRIASAIRLSAPRSGGATRSTRVEWRIQRERAWRAWRRRAWAARWAR